MSGVISMDLGTHDVWVVDVAEQVVANCLEADLLGDLASFNESVAKSSKDDIEKAFAADAAKRLRELSAWFVRHQP